MILMHPDIYREITRKVYDRDEFRPLDPNKDYLSSYFGEPVTVDLRCLSPVWVFPKDDGWVYGSEDEELCRAWGWGHEELAPAAFQVDGNVLGSCDFKLFCKQTGIPTYGP